MDAVIVSLAQYGAIGAVAVVLVYLVLASHKRMDSLTGRLVTIIENNTRALEQLRGTIENFLTHHGVERKR